MGAPAELFTCAHCILVEPHTHTLRPAGVGSREWVLGNIVVEGAPAACPRCSAAMFRPSVQSPAGPSWMCLACPVEDRRAAEKRGRLRGLREAQRIADLYNCAGQDDEATKIQDHLATVIRRIVASSRR